MILELLAQDNLLAQNNFGDTRSGGLAGPTGLVIILLLVVGTVLLIRNMNARLRRLPERFHPEKYERRSGQDAVPSAETATTAEERSDPGGKGST